MGNAAPRAQPQSVLDSASQYRTFLMDYTPRSMDMMFGSLIGDGKFLKSISCKCDEGHLVVKIYRKYDERESLTSAEVALRRLALAFSVEQQPNVIPYADFQLSNKYNVAFMVRQYFASNLYDRICSRPFLTMVEKKWIAFQILRALEQSHAKGICHGDIKQENVMVTSWNWVFLTDFAPFKPTYIPEDDPADYNYYFCAIDATRRGCSVAPERFYGKGSTSTKSTTGTTPGSASNKTPDAAAMLSKMADSEVTVEEVDKQFSAMGMNSVSIAAGNPIQTPPSVTSNGSAPSSYSRSRREGNLLESMDIFSAGCVIAELFLGGKPLFDLPSLLKYRTGNSEALRQQLRKVGDPRLEEMLLHMLQLDPNARLSASGYLSKYSSSSGLFPTYFDNFLFRFLVLVLSRGGKVPDARIRLVCKYYGRLVREVAGVEDPEGEEFFKLRLKEGYGSDRLATTTGGESHVAQRVLEELEHRIPTKQDKQKAERENAPLTRLQKIKEKENDMRGLSGTLQKKKIEKLHDQYNAITQRKKNSLLLDYSREPSTGRADDSDISSEAKEEENAGGRLSDSTRPQLSALPPHTSSARRMKPPTCGSEPWPEDRNGIVIILSLICSSVRHVQVPESKLTALYLIRALGQFTSDEARLQRLIPYLLEVIDDPSATVRALALRTITYLLSLVESFPLADASVFPQYILPAMVPFQSDPDELVRITFAECLPQLAETSRRFLEIAHAMKQKTLTSSASSNSLAVMSTRGNELANSSALYMASSSFDKELSVLHKMVSRFVIQLTTPDQKASSSLVKRALLVDITRLCVFFGRERTLDVVLPQLITFLNDPDWELRGAFFDYIVGVCSFVGRVAVEHNILPCIEQALFDVQEIVITKAVECLTGLCQLGLFRRKISTLVEKARMTCSLLLHPSWWIRDAVLKLMAQISEQMGSVDANVFLSPLIRPFLRKTMMFLPAEPSEDVTKRLRDCCRSRVSRETFDRALLASSSSSGLNEIIAEMERSVAQAPEDSDDEVLMPLPVPSGMNSTSRESLEDLPSEMSRNRRNRDALLSTDSLDGYNMYRQQSSGAAVASSAAVTAETISNSVENGVSSVYERRKNEIQSLKLMQQYVSIASMQMRSKLEMAKTEQAARMQGLSKSDRAGSPHGSVGSSSVSANPNASVGISNPFARKLSRSHLRVLFVPDMRFALSTAQPLKASNFGITMSSSASAASSITTTTATASSTSTALVTRSRGHTPGTSPSHRGGAQSTSAPANGGAAGGVPSLESLSLSHVGKMYSLVEPSTPISASPITVTGPSSVVPPGSVSSSLDDSGLSVHASQMDSNHFAPTSGGVMVSMLNMNMRDMYGGDGMSNLLDPHHHSVHSSPVSPPRQRMIKKAHTTYHHYFAFKESAMDPALGNPRKLLARLNALGIPPLPPDLGALRLSDGSPYSIYSHAPSPYCLVGGGFGIGGSSGIGSGPGSERNGISSVTSSPVQVGSSTYPPSGGAATAFNAAAAAATAINGHGSVSPGSYGSASSNGPGSSSSTSNGIGGGGYSSSYRNWQPRKNVLVAELAEHSGAVTRVNAAQDYSFLASASNDGTVKIWSVRSLQHSVNQGSRCTYDGQGGVITDMKVLTNSHSVASASSNGTVHVFRVDKVNASGGNVQTSGLKELRANNSAVMGIDYLNNVTEALLLYATRDGTIHAWDLRMRREAWTLNISPELGYVTCMTHSLDVSWFAVGTSRGFLCLWDLRFLVLIRIWRHSSHRAIHKLQPCLGLPNTLPLDETSVPLVFVAAGDGEIAVFDLSIGACRAVFRTLEAQASEAEACRCPTLLHVPIPHRSRSVLGSFLGIYGIGTAFDEISTSPLSEEPSVRAMLCPSLHLRGIGDALITGGEDRQLRYWDIRNGKQSYTICGNGEAKSFYDNQAAPNDWWRMTSSSLSLSSADPQRFGEMPAAPVATTAAITKPEMAWSKLSPPLITVCQDSSFYSTPGGVAGAAASGSGGVESAISMERRGLVPPSPAHTDCILDLTLVELGTSQNLSPMLVSCGRDALIKVWK